MPVLEMKNEEGSMEEMINDVSDANDKGLNELLDDMVEKNEKTYEWS